MGRIRRTFTLAKSSWRVIQHDRELLVLPVLSFLASAAVLVPLLMVAILVADTSSSTDGSGEESGDPAMLVIGVLAILVVSVVSVFFNGALVAGAHERFQGGNPTVGSALRRATE